MPHKLYFSGADYAKEELCKKMVARDILDAKPRDKHTPKRISIIYSVNEEEHNKLKTDVLRLKY